MSKIFEALQRLERDSGQLPPGVLREAQEVFANGNLAAHAVGGVVAEGPVEIPEEAPEATAAVSSFRQPAGVSPEEPRAAAPHSRADLAEDFFDLSQVPVEHAVITPASRVVYYSDPDSPGADRFRLLRMRLWPLWEAKKLKTLLITSAQAQDGKSTLVLNLATALAERGQRKVVLIEGDLCHPTLSKRVGLQNRAGLAECLEDGQDPLKLLRHVEPLGWYLLSSGDARGNPTEMLQSPTLAKIFERVSPHFDWVIIDSPPVIPLTDTLSLKHHADAGLLVVRAERTPRKMVETAVARVGSKHLLGLVLNATDELDRAYSDYGKYYNPRKKTK